VDIILQSIGRNGTKDISFTVNLNNLKDTIALLEPYISQIGANTVVYDDSVAKVSIVGAGLESHPGMAAKMFEALYEANINIHMISTSEIKISVLINRSDADRAVSVIHEKFFGEAPDV